MFIPRLCLAAKRGLGAAPAQACAGLGAAEWSPCGHRVGVAWGLSGHRVGTECVPWGDFSVGALRPLRGRPAGRVRRRRRPCGQK